MTAESDVLSLSLQDTEWPMEYTDHERDTVRAIVTDDEGYFYFMRVDRDDHFGRTTFIETSGGGVESGEDLITALRRELREELGAEVKIICEIGTVSDYYNLIHRHNINHYFLVKTLSFGDTRMTEEEIERFHLRRLRLTCDEALAEYEECCDTKIGRLVAAREVPVLKRAREILSGSDSI